MTKSLLALLLFMFISLFVVGYIGYRLERAASEPITTVVLGREVCVLRNGEGCVFELPRGGRLYVMRLPRELVVHPTSPLIRAKEGQ